MATQFNHKDSAERLLEAARLVDQTMHWETTPEGADYWDNVHKKLVERAEEVRSAGKTAISKGIPTTAVFVSPAQAPADPIQQLREKVNKALQPGEAKA